MRHNSILILALAFGLCGSITASATDKLSSPIGEQLQVFPGDKFYVEKDLVEKPSLVIPDDFESKVNGAMGFNFRFAINATTLKWTRRIGEWDYYAAPADKARAWHGLLGTVIADGDTVGIRVNSNGDRQWFVDNTIHNRNKGYHGTTIWHRELSPSKDVAVLDGPPEKVVVTGSTIRGLEYLGLRDGQLRIRYVELSDRKYTEDFFFPIDGGEPVLIGVMGLRAEVSEIAGSSVRIKILRNFKDDSFAAPVL